MPLRTPRLATAVVAIALAAAPVLAFGAPAYAGSIAQREWWLSKLHVTQAWKTGEGGGITVAVLADGVDASQPDLTGSVISGPDFTRSGRKPGGKYFGTIGTGLASLIAGHGYGGKTPDGLRIDGTYGVVGQAKVLSVRVTLSPDDPLWSDSKVTSRLPEAIAEGVRYAVDHRAAVIALPPDPALPGVAGWGNAPDAVKGLAAERAAIALAISKGIVVVAAAGDNAQSGDAISYPAAYPGVISVGAFNEAFIKAPFSSRRPYVTLTAAGEGVVAAAPTGYQTMNSTWAASAIVAGIAALLRSAFPSLSATQVRRAMTSGTVYHPARGRLHGSGYGTVDALRAVKMASTMSPPHAVQAMKGALPKQRPAAPRMPPQNAALDHQLIGDGEISGAVFVALLIPITLYGISIRRRDRRAAAAAAKRANRIQAKVAGGATLADPLLEFFGPQHASPSEPPRRNPVSTRYQPRPALSGRSTLSARPAMAAPAAAPPIVAPPAPGALPQPASAPPWEIDARAWESGAPPWENDAPPWENDAPPWENGPPWETSAPPIQAAPSAQATGFAPPAGPAPAARTPLATGQPPWAASPAVPASPVAPAIAAGLAAPAGAAGAAGTPAGPGTSPTGLPQRRPRHLASGGGQPPPDASSSPPWEPAPEPTTALPWASVPTPDASSGPFPDDYDAYEAQAPKSPFDPRLPWQADPGSGAHSTSDTGGRPIYVWNPPPGSSESNPGGSAQQGSQPETGS